MLQEGGVAQRIVRVVTHVLERLAEEAEEQRASDADPDDSAGEDEAEQFAPDLPVLASHRTLTRRVWTWRAVCGNNLSGQRWRSLRKTCGPLKSIGSGGTALRRVRQGLPPHPSAEEWGEPVRQGGGVEEASSTCEA